MKRVIVAIDGPAGAGKSSVSKAVAHRLGLALVDTGALYRCVALAARRAGVEATDDAALEKLLPTLDIRFKLVGGTNKVFLGDDEVTEAIRTPEVSRDASVFSARPVVRAGLLGLQRRLARAAEKGAVLEGRDIGTVVFPDAEVKVFLTASEQVRAERRHAELKAKGTEVPLEQVLRDQHARDEQDASRDVAPMKAAPDAETLDSSTLSLDEVVERIAALAARVQQT